MTEVIEQHLKSSLSDAQAGLQLYTILCSQYPNLTDKNLLPKFFAGRELHRLTNPTFNVFRKLLSKVKYHEEKKTRDSKRGVSTQPVFIPPEVTIQEGKETATPTVKLPNEPKEAYPPPLVEKLNQLGRLHNLIEQLQNELKGLGNTNGEEVIAKRKGLIDKMNKAQGEIQEIEAMKARFESTGELLLEPPKMVDKTSINEEIIALNKKISKREQLLKGYATQLENLKNLSDDKSQKKRASLLTKQQTKGEELQTWKEKREELKREKI